MSQLNLQWYPGVIALQLQSYHDDVIKQKHFSRYWPFMPAIHRHPRIPLKRPVTRSFDVFWSAPEQTVDKQSVIRDAIEPIMTSL